MEESQEALQFPAIQQVSQRQQFLPGEGYSSSQFAVIGRPIPDIIFRRAAVPADQVEPPWSSRSGTATIPRFA